MRKKVLTFGDLQLTIAELNTAQVDELTGFQAPDENTEAAWKARMWRTMLLSLNNAVKPPTKENPLGSDTEPQCAEDLQPVLGFATVNDLHREVLALSGLRSREAGESKATVDRSISGASTAA